ncbi:MAG TPA: amidohydrolase [Syntrophomonas sp.]|jgi:amidohydrolase|nr:amidohydrolase [Syntrophomonas sp.]
MSQLDQKIAGIEEELLELRKELHRFPELGFQEYRTAEKVAEYMSALGFAVETGIGGTGVIGLLRGGEGPVIAIRACLDALAVTEQSGVEYASQNPGVMHACGHDGNMAITLGAAKILAQYQDILKGSIKFIFQASEENTGGAAEVIKAGGLKNPEVGAIITLHNWHGIPQGNIVVKPGPVLASSDLFQLEIIGKAGHGAWPHLAVDPIPIAAEVISAFQHIVSREVDPTRPAAVSIGRIEGGTAENIISESVALYGTVRTLDEEVRSFIQKRIGEIARGLTQAARATCKLTYHRIMPPVDNDAQFTAFAAEVLRKAFSGDKVTSEFPPNMGCEEFSLYQQEIPGIFLFIGNDTTGRDIVPIHSPNYIFNDKILTVGVKALCEIALSYTGTAYD